MIHTLKHVHAQYSIMEKKIIITIIIFENNLKNTAISVLQEMIWPFT